MPESKSKTVPVLAILLIISLGANAYLYNQINQPPPTKAPPNIVDKAYTIPSTDGVTLEAFEKYVGPDSGDYRPTRVLLFVHGASFPAQIGFNLPVKDHNWMEYMALKGWDTWTFNLRGFGKSTHPPATPWKDVAAPEVGIQDTDAVVDYIKNLRKVDKVDLLGWSFGTIWGGLYVEKHPEKVNKYVAYAPAYQKNEPLKEILAKNEQVYTGNTYLCIKAGPPMTGRWQSEIKYDGQFNEEVAKTYQQIWLDSDPEAKTKDPPCARAPISAFYATLKQLRAGAPPYDPKKITVPTMVLRGEYDTWSLHDDAVNLYRDLGATMKVMVELPGGGHFYQYEKYSTRIFEAVYLFLQYGQ